MIPMSIESGPPQLPTNNPRSGSLDRRTQLRELYGLDFPDELFVFYAWHQSLTPEQRRAFGDVLGISLHGPFDVLAGKFDGVELRYPAVLHWRYQYDPPELFTVMVGDVDGLHWGYWFDDPGRLAPVVASFYARDAFELTEYPSLFHAVATELARCRRGIRSNRASDRANEATYDQELAALDSLHAALPKTSKRVTRTPTIATAEGMGIVVAPAEVVAWSRPANVDRAAMLQFVDEEIAVGRPGTALLVGRTLWDGAKKVALDVLVRAYAALDRKPLGAVAAAHRDHPAIPSLNLLDYQRGDYTDLRDALAHAAEVRTLTIHHTLDAIDADLSGLVNLEILQLAANRLSSLPASLAGCTKLREISLYNNRFTEIPGVIFALPALRTLTLGRNRLVSLDGVERCPSLVELHASENPLASLPAELGRLTALERLFIANTALPAAEFERVTAALPGVVITGKPAPESRPYSIKTKFVVGDTINHPTFGIGKVRALIDNKIEVEFTDSVKTLLHNRK